MTDPTVQQIQHDVNTRIAAFGEELAREMAPEIVELLDNHLTELKDETDPALWTDIHVPALSWHTLLHLADALEKQSRGWADVFFRNLRERWDKENG